METTKIPRLLADVQVDGRDKNLNRGLEGSGSAGGTTSALASNSS